MIQRLEARQQTVGKESFFHRLTVRRTAATIVWRLKAAMLRLRHQTVEKIPLEVSLRGGTMCRGAVRRHCMADLHFNRSYLTAHLCEAHQRP